MKDLMEEGSMAINVLNFGKRNRLFRFVEQSFVKVKRLFVKFVFMGEPFINDRQQRPPNYNQENNPSILYEERFRASLHHIQKEREENGIF